MQNTEAFKQTARLKIPEYVYSHDKYTAVKSYIGSDAEVIDIIPLNYIIDGYIIVDVIYISLLFNPLKIYYVERNSLKLYDVNEKNKFITEIPVNKIPRETNFNGKGNNFETKIMKNSSSTTEIVEKPEVPEKTNDKNKISVSITILDGNKFNQVIPIKIFKTLTNKLYPYYGLVQSYPMNEYCSLISFPEYRFITKMDVPEKLIDELDKNLKPKFSTETQLQNYKNIVTKLSYNTIISDIIFVKKFSEIDINKNSSFVVDINEIPANINAVIYCIVKRNIFDVLIIPDKKHLFTEDDLTNLKSFMYFEYQNYLEYYTKVK